jgi:hypothetical protein
VEESMLEYITNYVEEELYKKPKTKVLSINLTPLEYKELVEELSEFSDIHSDTILNEIRVNGIKVILLVYNKVVGYEPDYLVA